MTASQVTILLESNGKDAERLVKHLEGFLFKVEFRRADYLIIAKIDRKINKYQFQNYCVGFSEVIDSVAVSETDNMDIEEYKEDLGFKTGLEYVKENR